MIFKIGLSAFAVGVLSLLWSNSAISVKKYKVFGENNLRILHLSDLHKKDFGKNYEKLLKKIPDEKYDFICFTGDLVSRNETDFDNKISFMKSLLKIAPVFFVNGNHEAEGFEKYDALKNELFKIGVDILDNNSYLFKKGEENVVVAGFSSEKRFFRNEKNGFSDLYRIDADYLKQKLGEKKNCYTVLLSHSPFFFEAYVEWGADLTLCGHVHGGVVRLPFVGGVLSPERKFFPEYDGGIYEKNSKKMVVSKGLGKLRLFNPSEIVVIDIKKG